MKNAASETQEKDLLAPSQPEKSKLQEENCAPRTSRRQKKSAVTRNEDFYGQWFL